MAKWISVKTRLPNEDAICLIWNEKRPFNYLIAVYSATCKEWMHHQYGRVLEWPLEATHWMPLPEPPK